MTRHSSLGNIAANTEEPYGEAAAEKSLGLGKPQRVPVIHKDDKRKNKLISLLNSHLNETTKAKEFTEESELESHRRQTIASQLKMRGKFGGSRSKRRVSSRYSKSQKRGREKKKNREHGKTRKWKNRKKGN